MKKVFSIALLAALGLAAQTPAKAAKSSSGVKSKPAVKPTAKAPQAITIPKDAVLNSNGSYNWTDAQGKHWIFVRTPFGVMKTEDNPSATPAASNAPTGMKAYDEGDKVRFETQTPFGVIKREKNKSELTDEERALFNSQNPQSSAKQD